MGISLLIPSALRQFTGGKSELVMEAKTAREALERLVREYPPLKRHLFSETNELRSFVNIYVGDEDVRRGEGLDTGLADGATVLIVPSIAGGSPEAGASLPSSALPDLSSAEIERYSRHLMLPNVGIEGQRKLKNARVLLVGTGGLGAPVGMYLAAAGVGRLGIVDFDVVDVTNLQRQIIHGTRDVGRPKVASARDRLNDINPHIHVEVHETRLTSENALEILRDYDVIVDGTDNFPTRYLVNDACVLLGKPNVYGSIFRFEGQAGVFWARAGACYRCLYPEPPPAGLVPSCAEGGVFGVLPGIVGTIQANETIKLILGDGEPLINRLLFFDAWSMRFRELKLAKDPNCPVCGEHPSVTKLVDYEEFCGLKAPSDLAALEEVTATELKRRLDTDASVQLIDVREPFEFSIARIPNAKLIPLGQIVNRKSEIDPSRDAVLICRVGQRSAKAITELRQAGFAGRLVNLKGGMIAWSDEIDSTIPKY